jgi:hypothetical protein
MQISDNNLEWLFFGDENQQIIDKLTNTYDQNLKLKKYIYRKLKSQRYFDIHDVLVNIMLSLKGNLIDSKIVKSNITEDQEIRLNELDQKFGLLKNYDLPQKIKIIEQRKKDIEQEKFNIIKNVIIENKYTHYHIMHTNKVVEFFNNCEIKLEQNNLRMTRNDMFHIADKIFKEGVLV